MHFSTALSQTFTFVILALPLATFSYPVNSTHILKARATCGDGSPSPCICNNALGLRLKNLPCNPLIGFHFVNPNDPKDGTVKEVTGPTASVGKLQCDHVVELQFIADEIAKKPGICTHFTANPADFRTFFNTINGRDNLVFVEGTVNGAKGVAFGGGQFDKTTVKAASGVVSYLNLLKRRTSAPFVGGAQAIGDELNRLVGAANSITNFQAAYTAEVNSVIASVQKQVNSGKLLSAPAPGDPFVDETASTIARCQRKRTTWEEVKALVVRATTGKKTPPPATSCALPAKSTKATKTSTSAAGKATGKSTPKSTGKVTPKKVTKSTTKVTKSPKTAAKTTGKATVKKATPKKTVAKTTTKATVKKATPKKTVAKATAKATVKKATPKKIAAKKPAAKKPVAKKTVAKKVPVKRPVAKKPVRKGRL